MLLRRFGGRRRLDIVLGLFVCFGKGNGRWLPAGVEWCPKKGARVFCWERLAFNWTWPSLGQSGIGKGIGNSRTAKVL